MQIKNAVIDSLGFCTFTGVPLKDDPLYRPAMVDMLNARFGTNKTAEEVFDAFGTYVLKTKHRFNLDAGLSNEHDRLLEFISMEQLPPHNVLRDFTGEEIDTFWRF
jgi:aldehyde:ferredoxin oxidoreductase